MVIISYAQPPLTAPLLYSLWDRKRRSWWVELGSLALNVLTLKKERRKCSGRWWWSQEISLFRPPHTFSLSLSLPLSLQSLTQFISYKELSKISPSLPHFTSFPYSSYLLWLSPLLSPHCDDALHSPVAAAVVVVAVWKLVTILSKSTYNMMAIHHGTCTSYLLIVRRHGGEVEQKEIQLVLLQVVEVVVEL